MHSYSIKKIGEKNGSPRLWIEGTTAERAGFEPGQAFNVAIDVERNMLTLTCDAHGVRVVSSRSRRGRTLPIIDINSAKVLALFQGMDAVRVFFLDGEIRVMPLATELRRIERLERLATRLENSEPLAIGSVSHGGGVLSHALHTGLRNAGIPVRLAFANDIRDDLLEHARDVNDAWDKQTVSIAAPLQELAFDDEALCSLGQIDIAELGLPCSAASAAGRARRGLKIAEDHEHVGHLVAGALALIGKTNPSIILIENVTRYANIASASILRGQLRDMGYDVHEATIDSADWNALEHRERWALVAVTRGITFDFNQLARPHRITTQLSHVLEDIALDDPRWSAMDGLKQKMVRDREKGNNFKMQIFNGESPMIGTLTRGIAKNRSTDPKIQSPFDPDLLRIPTPIEHARCKQIPAKLIAGLSATTAHELLGQSIVWQPFRAIGELIGATLLSWWAGEHATAAHRATLRFAATA